MTEDNIDTINNMSDLQKLTVVSALIKNLSQESKDKIMAELLGGNVTGEAKVTVSSNDELVRVDFGRPLAWFAIPKIYAIQLGASLMQHGGANIQQIVKPDAGS